MFQQVASTSRVVSLTLRDWVDGELAPSPHLLSAHWLPEEDRPHLLGLPHLHERLRQLVQNSDWEVWGLGYDPKAQVSYLQSALARKMQRFQVAIVGGHGDAARYGVRMADALFGGPDGHLNTDLSGLDLLCLVACAVGRVQQLGDSDVEGLYADLAAHGVRSVIAAGWKIADREAAIFATEVVRQYLEGRREPFRVARALNRARKALLPLESGPDRVSWHLASAFELHGRG